MAVICDRGHGLALSMTTIWYHLPYGPRAGGARKVHGSNKGSRHELYPSSSYEDDKDKCTDRSVAISSHNYCVLCVHSTRTSFLRLFRNIIGTCHNCNLLNLLVCVKPHTYIWFKIVVPSVFSGIVVGFIFYLIKKNTFPVQTVSTSLSLSEYYIQRYRYLEHYQIQIVSMCYTSILFVHCLMAWMLEAEVKQVMLLTAKKTTKIWQIQLWLLVYWLVWGPKNSYWHQWFYPNVPKRHRMSRDSQFANANNHLFCLLKNDI